MRRENAPPDRPRAGAPARGLDHDIGRLRTAREEGLDAALRTLEADELAEGAGP